MSQLLVLLHSLPDPRFLRKPEHPLTDILVIALCSTLCGGRSFVDMEDFGRAWEPWLRSHLALKLPHGIPSWHTFRRVLSALDPHCFADVFHRCAAALPAFQPPLLPAEQGAPQRQIAVDGKAVCGSRRRGSECQPVMLVNAWLAHGHSGGHHVPPAQNRAQPAAPASRHPQKHVLRSKSFVASISPDFLLTLFKPLTAENYVESAVVVEVREHRSGIPTRRSGTGDRSCVARVWRSAPASPAARETRLGFDRAALRSTGSTGTNAIHTSPSRRTLMGPSH